MEPSSAWRRVSTGWEARPGRIWSRSTRSGSRWAAPPPPRTADGVAPIVAAGVTAAVIHQAGDFFLDDLDFIVPARKGTRFPGVRLRIRHLTRAEVIPVNALPTLTIERAIADLVEQRLDLTLVANVVRDALRVGKLVSPDRLITYLDPLAPDVPGHCPATMGVPWPIICSSWSGRFRKDGTVTEATDGYADWRSLELAIKDAAKKAAREAGPRVGAATVDARIRQARFDRFLCRVFAAGEQSEWLLKGGMSTLARVPQSRTTRDMDLAAGHAADLDEAARALA
jgi:hypothetical protein